MTDTLVKDGYIRYIYQDCVHWLVGSRKRRIEYCVVRFPFVPDYHLCDLLEDDPGTASMPALSERPLQQFKTLTQALAVLRVIEGSNP